MDNKYGIKKYTMEDLEKDYNGNGKLRLTQCPCCEGVYERNDMNWTTDCHGINYRLVCVNCWDICMEEGYDGAYYSEADECIDYDY